MPICDGLQLGGCVVRLCVQAPFPPPCIALSVPRLAFERVRASRSFLPSLFKREVPSSLTLDNGVHRVLVERKLSISRLKESSAFLRILQQLPCYAYANKWGEAVARTRTGPCGGACCCSPCCRRHQQQPPRAHSQSLRLRSSRPQQTGSSQEPRSKRW